MIERTDSAKWMPKRVGDKTVFIEPETGVEFKLVKPESATVHIVTPHLGLHIYLAPSNVTEKPRLCPRHPAYGAKRKPRSNCPTCWDAYTKQKGEREE